MECERCKEVIGKGEEREHHGQILCEDCYMDLLSPARTCDPWAVHSAQTLAKTSGRSLELTEIQKAGGLEPGVIVERLKIKPADLEREVAALRHMEKIRGELRQGKKFLIPW